MKGKYELIDSDIKLIEFRANLEILKRATAYFSNMERRSKCIERWRKQIINLKNDIARELLNPAEDKESILSCEIKKFSIKVEKGIKANLSDSDNDVDNAATLGTPVNGACGLTDSDILSIIDRANLEIVTLATAYFPIEERRRKCIERWEKHVLPVVYEIEIALLQSEQVKEHIISSEINKFRIKIETGIKKNLGVFLNLLDRKEQEETAAAEASALGQNKAPPPSRLRKLKGSSSTLIGTKKTLVFSTDGMEGQHEDDEPLSSNELPLGMNNYQFALLCNQIVTHFESGRLVDGDTEYHPPEFLCFKGSSATGISYAAEKMAKTFGTHSDYDCILIWQQGIDAMINLNLRDVGLPRNLQLDASGDLRFLNLHSDDRRINEKELPDKRRIFPNGIPHILFCENLKSKMHTEHPLNFVVLRSLKDIVLANDIIQTPAVLDKVEKKRVHEKLKHYVFEERAVSGIVKQLFFPHNMDSCSNTGQVLVYSWRLMKLYNELFCYDNLIRMHILLDYLLKFKKIGEIR